ncbi:hypothetical protein OHS18_20730 [Amycolatopsis sp. NBC_00355]|uniref:hypothetical protein n=1 Tax=Amycolatopsis sp. NBC_00355 TaxID=2975957 RepID=UPI002E26F424
MTAHTARTPGLVRLFLEMTAADPEHAAQWLLDPSIDLEDDLGLARVLQAAR